MITNLPLEQEPIQSPQVTIMVVPRDRFSHSEQSLANIYAETTFPFKLLYISAGTPPFLRRNLERESQRRGFKLVHTSRYLSPNMARNLGLRELDTKYVVFLDNDALVTRGWLEALVGCAEETGAWVVGPLYLIGQPECGMIHVARGTLHIKEQEGKRTLYDEQYLFNTPLAQLSVTLKREQCDYAEFHCMLVRTEVFDRLGPLDEELLSLHEHIDFCLGVRNAGGSVYIEPKAVTTYIPPPPCEWWDLPYFMLRWSEAWNLATVRHFNTKWGMSSVRHISDKSNSDPEDTFIRFARGQRRLMTGLRISTEVTEGRPELPLEHAELMMAMFQSVDRDCFDLMLTTEEESVIEFAPALDPQAVLERLPCMLEEAEKKNLNVMMRPLSRKRHGEPLLIRVDDLDLESLCKVRRSAFLTLETRPQSYQCWLAVDRKASHTTVVMRTLVMASLSQPASQGFVRLAGSKNFDLQYRDSSGSYPLVKLVEAVAGLLITERQLEGSEARPYLWRAHVA
jgi:hypothetical protein